MGGFAGGGRSSADRAIEICPVRGLMRDRSISIREALCTSMALPGWRFNY